MERDVFQVGKPVKVPWWAWDSWRMSPPRRFDAGGGVEDSRERGNGESSAKEYKAVQSRAKRRGPGRRPCRARWSGARASLEDEDRGAAIGRKQAGGREKRVKESGMPGRRGQGGLDRAGSEARHGADGRLGDATDGAGLGEE